MDTAGGNLRVENRKLFFSYAHPCGDVLVRRGSMDARVLARIRENLRKGESIPERPELFKVAYALMKMLAEEMGKSRIDDEVMHEYYWRRHDGHVMDEAKIKSDIVPEMCIIFPARIVNIEGNEADVEILVGRRRVNIEFVPKVSVGDYVTVHYCYACEKINENLFRSLWREKNGK